MKKVSKLDKAKAALVLDHPFVASVLLRREMKPRKDIPYLGIDKRATIYYNPETIEGLTVQQLVWGLAHETFHYIGSHFTRQGHRNAKKWNYAGDAWINDTLTNAKIGDPIEGTVNMPGSKDKYVEQIYDELPEDDGGEGEGGQGGMGDDILDEGKPLSESEAREMEARVKIEVAEAAQAAKMRGKLSGALSEFVADFLESKTPWHEILERYMVGMTSQDLSWNRPNKRYLSGGFYLPATAKQPSMGEVVLQIDVSGSINEIELAAYNGHVARIVDQCQPEKVHVLYTDTQVVRHQTFEQGEEVKLEFMRGGGTDMPAGFDYVAEQGIEPEVFVCLTDGYTGWGEAPGFPVVWCISSDVNAPYGDNIHFELEH